MTDLPDEVRDDLDSALTRTLRGAAGPEPESAAALGALEPRLVRARLVRRLRLAGAAAVVIAGVVVIALAVGPGAGPRSRVIVPAGHGTGTVTSSRPSASTTTGPASTATTTTGPVPDASQASGGARSSAPTAAPSNAPTADATPPAAPPAPETHTYTAPGGQVTVRFAGGALTLLGATANAGYTAEIDKSGPDDVDVRFRADRGSDSRIRVRVEGASLRVETS